MRFINNFLSIFLLFCFTINCNRNDMKKRFMNDSGQDIDDLKELIKNNGDTIAYSDFQTEMLDILNGQDTLYVYAKIMADKFHYLPAYYDVYFSILIRYDSIRKKTNQDEDDLLSVNMDMQERKTALKYLIIGKEKGSKFCSWELGQYYRKGKFLTKDTIIANELQYLTPPAAARIPSGGSLK